MKKTGLRKRLAAALLSVSSVLLAPALPAPAADVPTWSATSELACRRAEGTAETATSCRARAEDIVPSIALAAGPPSLPVLSTRCSTGADLVQLGSGVGDFLACRADAIATGTAARCDEPSVPTCTTRSFETISRLVSPDRTTAISPAERPSKAAVCQAEIARAAGRFVARRAAERAQGQRRSGAGDALRPLVAACEGVELATGSSGELLPRVGEPCRALLGPPGTTIDAEPLAGCIRATLERAIDDAAPQAIRPSIVLVVTDDQRWDTLAFMPELEKLSRQGLVFRNAFATTPLCTPSRASILSGLYAHHHGVVQNMQGTEFDPTTSFAPRLSSVGYKNALLGKYVNALENLGERPPPGWDEWQAFRGGEGGGFYGFRLNDNGVFRDFDMSVYSTDYLRDEAVEFIAANAREPFFVLLAPFAPHQPATPARRHAGAYANLPPWRPPSWQEADVADKPRWVKSLKSATRPSAAAQRDSRRIKELESLLAVDEAVARIALELEEQGLTDNTLLVFTSDHGIHWGEHWSSTKFSAYEESIRVPLVMRYPSRVPVGGMRDELVLLVDLAPTFAELAGARVPSSLDGASLVPLLDGTSSTWREAFAIGSRGEFIIAPAHAFRTQRWKYIKTDARHGITEELYDLQNDPYELHNLARNHAYAEIRDDLAARFEALTGIPLEIVRGPEPTRRATKRAWERLRRQSLSRGGHDLQQPDALGTGEKP